jgi:hypothetical protein
MATKASRKSTTSKKRKRRIASQPSTAVKRGELPPLRLTPEQMEALRNREAELQAGRRLLDRAMAAQIWGPHPAKSKIAKKSEAVRHIATKVWVIAEAERLKRLDKISDGITMTDFAKRLADNLADEAKTNHSISVRVVGWKYIRNHLREWDIWPVSAIQ